MMSIATELFPSAADVMAPMKAAAVVLCLVAVAALGVAIRDIVLDTGSARRGLMLRAIALLAFVLAVILNVISG